MSVRRSLADTRYVWYKKHMRTLSADYKYDNKSPKKSVKILDTRAARFSQLQQTANSKQQTANSKQQTANSKQQTANSEQKTA